MREKLPHKLHTLAASLNMDGDLAFDDGVSEQDAGREVDHYLIVRAEYKRRLFECLGHAFDGISNTSGTADDERLLYALERVAHGGYWKSLGDVEAWLMDRGIPFTAQKRSGIK